MWHKIYWGDIDLSIIQMDQFNPEILLFAVWENQADGTSQMYFVTDPILVYDLAHKNQEEEMAQSTQGDKYTGKQIMNMIQFYVPANRHYAVGKRLS